MFFVLFALFLLPLCYLLLRPCLRPPNFPPGPPCLPVMGTLPMLFVSYGGDMLAFARDMAKKYGKVFSFNMGMDRTVVVSDFDIAKEACSKEEFSWRPSLGALGDARFPDDHGYVAGIMFNNGRAWSEQRRFSLKSLRDFGFGKTSMEDLIQDEVDKAVALVKGEMLGRPVSLRNSLNLFVLNSLWKIMSGEKLDYGDPRLKMVVARIHNILTNISTVGAIQLFPWLKHVAPEATGYRAMNDAMMGIRVLAEDLVKEHKKEVELTGHEDNEESDYIYTYLKKLKAEETKSGDENNNECNNNNESNNNNNEIKQDKSANSNTVNCGENSFVGARGEQNLMMTMLDFFIAGSDTVSSTMEFAVLLLSMNQDIQRKAREELNSVLQGDRPISLSDRPSLPYVEAVIAETHRFSALAYLSVPRQLQHEVRMREFVLPAGTRVFFDLYAIMRDPDHWEAPEEFRPERFIDEEGKFRPDERCVAFGMGRRSCMGVSLAQNEMFLFLCAFLRHFRFSLPEGASPPDLHNQPVGGFLRSCPEYQVQINQVEA